MNAAEVLALYDETMRRDPPPIAGVEHAWVGPVLRTSGVYNFIECADLTPENADAAIAGEVAYFKAFGKPFEWKVFGHDAFAGLAERLAAHGLEPGDLETFLAYEVARPLPPSRKPGPKITVRAITKENQLPDLATVIEAAFGRVIPDQMEAIRLNIGKGVFTLYIAYDEQDRPVGSGRLDTPQGRPFCGLYAGGVVPGAREKGVYRAVVEARIEAARALGYRYAIVEAGPMSLPILQRLGFEALTTTQPYEFNP